MNTPKNEWKCDIRVARELLYPKSVIEALMNEPDPYQRQKILTNARKAMSN